MLFEQFQDGGMGVGQYFTLPGYSMWNPWNGGWTAEIPGGFHGMVDGFHME